jgi:hypothetical protein
VFHAATIKISLDDQAECGSVIALGLYLASRQGLLRRLPA